MVISSKSKTKANIVISLFISPFAQNLSLEMSYASPRILDENYCNEHAVPIVTTGYYRLSLALSLLISTVSLLYLLHFFYTHHKKFYFHQNIKVLLTTLFLCCFLYDCFNVIIKIHHIVLSCAYTTPCDLYLSTATYIIQHIPIIFVSFCTQFVQFAIVFERTIATICVRNYERGYKSLAPALVLIAVILSLGMLMVLYYKESFNGPFLNARMLPPSTAALGNVVLILLIVLNFTALICAVALHFVNQRKRIRDTLSSKFQLMENRITADLLFWAASIQFSSCLLNDVAVLMVRLYLSQSQYAMAFKENVDLVNIYTFVLPVLTTIYLKKVKQRRLRDIKKNLGIKAIGYEGWQNYSAYTQRQWK